VRFAKVGKPIVPSVAVYVINLIGWPAAGYVKKCKSVRFVIATENANPPIAIAASATGNRSSLYAAWAISEPSEHARLGIIRDDGP